MPIVTEYEFPSKAFYYATNNFHFKRLPAIQSLFKDKIEEFNGPFTGNPDLTLFEKLEVREIPQKIESLLEVQNPHPEQLIEGKQNDEQLAGDQTELLANEERLEDLEQPSSQPAPEPPEERLLSCKELDRLAFTVRAIEFECSCLPLGSLRLVLTHELRYNGSFKGLDLPSALRPESWLHFRQPLSEAKRLLMQTPEAVFRGDLLEEIGGDLPGNCWGIQGSVCGEFVG